MTRKRFGLVVLFPILGLGLAGAGCSETSFFSVDVVVNGATGRSTSKMAEVGGVEVYADGAVSDEKRFVLQNIPRDNYDQRDSNSQIILGKFEYGTTQSSGDVIFYVTVFNGAQNSLARGSGDGTIQSGGNVALTVTVEPNDAWNNSTP